MKQIRVNMRSSVANASIRRERDENGRQVIIVPSATLPFNVIMNGGLYPKEEIEASYHTLEGTPAPLGHPMVKGQLVNATHPAAINGYWIGAYNANVRIENNRVLLDKVIDVEVAERTEGGRRVIDAINAGEPIHTSTGLVCEKVPAPKGAKGYTWIARNMVYDHDAILLDEPGAATPEQGVGMMVNGQQVDVMTVNVEDAVITPEASYEAKRERLRAALPDAWVVDYDDERVVYEVHDTNITVSRTYTDDGTSITLTGEPEPVTRQTSWIKTLPVVNRILRLLNSGAKHEKPSSTEEIDVDKTELEAILAANAEATAKAVADAIAPLATAVNAVSETLTANQRHAEAEKRAVVEKVLGKAAADALTGNALDEAYAKLTDGKAPALNTANAVEPNGRDAYNTAPEE